VRKTARHERACSGTTDCSLIANLERDFAAQDIGDLNAIVVKVQRRIGIGWRDFLKHHHARGSLSGKHFESG
jgi:hypothetical protein